MYNMKLINRNLRFARDNLNNPLLTPDARLYWEGYHEALQDLHKDICETERNEWVRFLTKGEYVG